MPKPQQTPQQFVISTRTIITTLLILISAWVLYQVRSIALAVFVSLILALAFDPLVDWLQKRRIPRGFGVLMTYVLVLVLFAVLGGIGLGSLAQQFKELLFRLKDAAGALQNIPTIGDYLSSSVDTLLSELTPQAGTGVFKVTLTAFSSAASLVTVLIFTAYLLLDFANVKQTFLNLFSRPLRLKAEKTMKDVEEKLGAWLRAQLVLMIIVGLFTFIGLSVLGMNYALSLALIAGLFEVIPLIGPIISAIPAVIIGFTISPVMGLGVLALYILVQQLENNVFVPKVMQKSVGFNPLVTMLALMVGGELFGFIGVLLAVPVTLTGYIVIKNLLD